MGWRSRSLTVGLQVQDNGTDRSEQRSVARVDLVFGSDDDFDLCAEGWGEFWVGDEAGFFYRGLVVVHLGPGDAFAGECGEAHDGAVDVGGVGLEGFACGEARREVDEAGASEDEGGCLLSICGEFAA